MRRLKDTLIEGNNAFLASLDPRQVASDLVDDRFVRQALAEGRRVAGVRPRRGLPAQRGDQPVRQTLRQGALGVAGLLTLFALWWLGVALFGAADGLSARFSPQATFAQPG